MEGDSAVERAYNASVASRLSVGVGFDDAHIIVHYKNLKPENPLFDVAITDAASIRKKVGQTPLDWSRSSIQEVKTGDYFMQSIGYLEVEGLPGAIVAADRMLKTADVDLKYVENTKGGGWITVSVTGDVAAVQAAIDAGIGELGDHVYCSDVIANPAPGIETLGKNDAIKGNHLDDKGPDDPKGPDNPKGSKRS